MSVPSLLFSSPCDLSVCWIDIATLVVDPTPPLSNQSSTFAGTRYCAIHRQATRGLWLCVSGRLMLDSLVVFQSDSEWLQLSRSRWFRRWSFKNWSAGNEVCAGGQSDHWPSRGGERVTWPHWSAHWGASTRKQPFALFECQRTDLKSFKRARWRCSCGFSTQVTFFNGVPQYFWFYTRRYELGWPPQQRISISSLWSSIWKSITFFCLYK